MMCTHPCTHPWYTYLSAEGRICITHESVEPTINIPMASWERAEMAVEILNRKRESRSSKQS